MVEGNQSNGNLHVFSLIHLSKFDVRMDEKCIQPQQTTRESAE